MLLFLERFTDPRSAARILPFSPNFTGPTRFKSKPPLLYCIAERTKRTKLKESGTQRMISFHDNLLSLKANSFVYLPYYDSLASWYSMRSIK